MTDSLSLGWTQAQADKARSSYRRLLGINLAIQALAALAVLVWASDLLALIHLPASGATADWARAWAVMLLLVSAFQVPGWQQPVFNRLPNIIGILGRAAMAVVFLLLGGGFLWLALFDAVFAVVLYLSYRGLIIAELQTRP